MLEIENINKSYSKQKDVLNNISLSFDKGLVCILGKSGSGKSTLLNILGSLDKADGSIYVDGKDISKLKEKELDYYRNTYVGFIFQDFNLIEDYTVYENIVLPLKLQNKKIDNDKIDSYLKRLGIYEYKNRKPSELSGGERQRVAILRAIIKNPKILLADEATGNLDSKTGIEVMELLKEISNDRLVILVTHNIEYANKYADKIIKIEDGKVENEILKHEDNYYKSVKSKLPFLYSFKLGFKSILNHKFRFLLSCFILSLSITLFLSFYKVISYDINKAHLNKLDDEVFEIKNVSYLKDGSFLSNTFYDYSNIDNVVGVRHDYLDKDLKSNFYEIFKLDTYVNEDMFNGEMEDERSKYYEVNFPIKLFVSENYDNLIGSRVIKKGEMVITSYIADLFIKYGVYNSSGKLINPKSYEELLNQKFILNDKALIIKGIIKYDTSKYDDLKEITNTDYDLYEDFISNREKLYSNIYVTKDFVSDFYIDEVDNTNYTYKLDNNIINISKYDSSYFYDGVTYKKIDKLKDNEIILDLSSIIDADSFKEEYFNLTYNNPDNETVKSFIINSIKKYNVSYKVLDNVNVAVYLEKHLPGISHEDIFKKLNLKVIGFTLGANYMSSNVLDDFRIRLFPISSILVSGEKNEIINKYPYGGKYIVYSSSLLDIVNTYSIINKIKNILFIVSLLFLLFSVVLAFRFISLSVNDNRKKIGILKSLGSNSLDIFKIFMVEALFLTLFTFCFSFINVNVLFSFFNNYYYSNIGLFSLYLSDYLLMFLFSFIVYFISTYLAIFKMLKSKIIELIYR